MQEFLRQNTSRETNQCVGGPVTPVLCGQLEPVFNENVAHKILKKMFVADACSVLLVLQLFVLHEDEHY